MGRTCLAEPDADDEETRTMRPLQAQPCRCVTRPVLSDERIRVDATGPPHAASLAARRDQRCAQNAVVTRCRATASPVPFSPSRMVSMVLPMRWQTIATVVAPPTPITPVERTSCTSTQPF